MFTKLWLTSGLLLLCLCGATLAQSSEYETLHTDSLLSEMTVSQAEVEEKMTRAIDMIHDFVASDVPSEIRQQTQAVVIIPSLFRVSFILGGKTGTGLLLFRLPDGTWSSPLFVLLSGGSVGLQLGASSSDMLLLFRSAADLEALENGKVTLTAIAAVAVGSFGKASVIATDIRFKADIYAWLHNWGLFLGVALEGALLDLDVPTMQAFYAPNEVSFNALRHGTLIHPHPLVRKLRDLLN
jgi:lipid-binding SYLF domain-containing protein